MKIRRVVALVKKDLKMFAREPAALFMLLLFPLVVSVVFGVAFGGMNNGGDVEFQIGIVNMDGTSTNSDWSDSFIGNLTEINGTIISHYDNNETGQVDLINGNLHALIVIPEGFGDSIDSYWSSPLDGGSWDNTTIELYLDSGSMIGSSAIPSIVQQVLFTTIYGEQAGSMELPVNIGSPSLVYVSDLNQWDFMAPGIFAFAAIFMIMIVGQSMTADRDSGLLSRIATTPVTSADVILAKAMTYMVVGFAQVLIVFGGSFAIGYQPNTDAVGIAFAFLIVMVFTLSAVGMGLITAVISKTADIASGVAFVFIMPQMFFGTFMPLGGITETVGVYMPSNYVTHALTTLFLRGAPISTVSIWIDLLIVAVVGVVMLAIGAILFSRQSAKH
ncbi:MAG: ABC transporter permease [Candidatus Thorarchaeota archaeon]|jgi:ABC-2 type transport system permease protein